MQHSAPKNALDHDIEIVQKVADKLKSIYGQEFIVEAETTLETGDFHMVSYTEVSITVMVPDTSFFGAIFQWQVKETVLHYIYPALGIFDWNEKYPEVKTLFDKYSKLRN
jgi:hypothetical protein